MIGFKFHKGFKEITYVTYSIGKFGDIEYYKKAFRIIASKTREYLKEKKQTLTQKLEGIGEINKTAVFLGGLDPFLKLVKEGCDKEGIIMTIDYKNGLFKMIVDD